MPTDEFQHLRERGLTQESVYRGRVIKLRVDTVALPNGQVSNREIVEHPGAVAIVPLLADGKVVLVRQFRYSIGQITLEIPAGTCELGEEVEATARRELLEEAGCAAGFWKYLGEYFLAPGYSTELIRLYLARDLSFPPGDRPVADDFVDTVVLDLDDALAMVRDGRINDAKTVIGLWTVAGMRG